MTPSQIGSACLHGGGNIPVPINGLFNHERQRADSNVPPFPMSTLPIPQGHFLNPNAWQSPHQRSASQPKFAFGRSTVVSPVVLFNSFSSPSNQGPSSSAQQYESTNHVLLPVPTSQAQLQMPSFLPPMPTSSIQQAPMSYAGPTSQVPTSSAVPTSQQSSGQVPTSLGLAASTSQPYSFLSSALQSQTMSQQNAQLVQQLAHHQMLFQQLQNAQHGMQGSLQHSVQNQSSMMPWEVAKLRRAPKQRDDNMMDGFSRRKIQVIINHAIAQRMAQAQSGTASTDAIEDSPPPSIVFATSVFARANAAKHHEDVLSEEVDESIDVGDVWLPPAFDELVPPQPKLLAAVKAVPAPSLLRCGDVEANPGPMSDDEPIAQIGIPPATATKRTARGGAAAKESYSIHMTRSSGDDSFEGFFGRNGKRNGKGRYTWADGTVALCMWSDGCCDPFDEATRNRT